MCVTGFQFLLVYLDFPSGEAGGVCLCNRFSAKSLKCIPPGEVASIIALLLLLLLLLLLFFMGASKVQILGIFVVSFIEDISLCFSCSVNKRSNAA